VRIDGVRHEGREQLTLSTGRHRVVLAVGDGWGDPVFVDVPSVPCTLRDVPEVSCK
jgi:hypothetical protein